MEKWIEEEMARMDRVRMNSSPLAITTTKREDDEDLLLTAMNGGAKLIALIVEEMPDMTPREQAEARELIRDIDRDIKSLLD